MVSTPTRLLMPAIAGIFTMSSSALALNHHTPPGQQPPGTPVLHTQVTPKICGIEHNATSVFVNVNRTQVLQLSTVNDLGVADIPYGDARNQTNPVFSTVTFDVSNNFTQFSFVTLSVTDPATGLLDTLSAISMTGFHLAAVQDNAAHGFTTLTASSAVDYLYPAGATFRHAAFGQAPDGTTIQVTNIQINNLQFAQAVLVTPTQDCISVGDGGNANGPPFP
jgi:hypothetical protein